MTAAVAARVKLARRFPRRTVPQSVKRAAAVSVTWIGARCCAYPLRTGMLAGAAVLVLADLGVEAAALAAGTVATSLYGIASAILRRSLRDPLELSRSVKSLQLRRRVRRRWQTAMIRTGLTKPVRSGESAIPKRRRVRLTDIGVTTRVNMAPIAATADELQGKRRNLESTFRAVDSRVREIGPGWAELELRHTDPLARRITTRDLPKATKPRHVVTGLDADNCGVERDVSKPNLWVGAQGSGKSTEERTAIHALVRRGVPIRLRVFDPKIQEFADLANVAHAYENDYTKWPRFICETFAALKQRQADLAEHGIANLTRYTVEFPLDVLLIDELLFALTMKSAPIQVATPGGRRKLTAGDAFGLVLSQGRAAGHTVFAATQLPQKAVLTPQVADLFTYKTCLRTSSDEQVDMVLGPGMAKHCPAHKLPPDEACAGYGYVDTFTGRGIVKYRAAILTDVERRWLVRQLAVWKGGG